MMISSLDNYTSLNYMGNFTINFDENYYFIIIMFFLDKDHLINHVLEIVIL